MLTLRFGIPWQRRTIVRRCERKKQMPYLKVRCFSLEKFGAQLEDCTDRRESFKGGFQLLDLIITELKSDMTC